MKQISKKLVLLLMWISGLTISIHKNVWQLEGAMAWACYPFTDTGDNSIPDLNTYDGGWLPELEVDGDYTPPLPDNDPGITTPDFDPTAGLSDLMNGLNQQGGGEGGSGGGGGGGGGGGNDDNSNLDGLSGLITDEGSSDDDPDNSDDPDICACLPEICYGSNNNNNNLQYDCAEVLGGSAYTDKCGNCVGGITMKQPCNIDCAGVVNGSAYFDNCQQCVSGTTGKQPCTTGCVGYVCVVCGKFTKVTQGQNCDMCPGHPCNSFEGIAAKVLIAEGPYSNSSSDPGGATTWGIDWADWVEHAQSILGIAPTLDNLKNLTTSDAMTIYKIEYWNVIQADQIEDGDIRYLMFDFSFNSGIRGATLVLQQTINQFNGSHISEDGIMGIQTMNALNAMDPTTLYNAFKQARLNFINSAVSRSVNKHLKNNPNATQKELLKHTLLGQQNGLHNRINTFKNRKPNESNINCN